jgi:hypothetical protein
MPSLAHEAQVLTELGTWPQQIASLLKAKFPYWPVVSYANGEKRRNSSKDGWALDLVRGEKKTRLDLSSRSLPGFQDGDVLEMVDLGERKRPSAEMDLNR